MAIVLAKRAQGTVSVLHVVEWFDWGQQERRRFLNVPEYPQQAVEDAHARLTSLVPRSVRCEVKVLDLAVAPRPYTAVLREAEANPADLIARPDPIFGVAVPLSCPDVPAGVLNPRAMVGS